MKTDEVFHGRFLVTWMGYTEKRGGGMGDDGGFPERKYFVTDDLEDAVRIADGHHPAEIFNLGTPVVAEFIDCARKDRARKINEEQEARLVREVSEGTAMLKELRTRQGGTYCVWYVCDLDKGPCKCIQGQP